MSFFESQQNRRSIIVDAAELEKFLRLKGDPEMFVLIMALIHEHVHEKYHDALKEWQKLTGDKATACRKTVSILKKSAVKDRQTIFINLEWVLREDPKIGLSLFLDRNQTLGKKDRSKSSAHTKSEAGS